MPETNSEPSNEVLRSLLTDAFNHEELVTLCFDRLPELHEDVKNWPLQKGVRELIDYCRRRGRIGDLLEAVEERNPEQYQRYAPYITKEFSAVGPGIATITVEIPNDKELIEQALRNLAGILSIEQNQICAVRIRRGSVKLTTVLPAEAIDRLLALFDDGDERLVELGIKGVSLERPDLLRILLRGANLHGADLRGANLRRAILSRANLREADLSGADLRGANLVGAAMSRTALSETKLLKAMLHAADLRGANLSMADLRGASLRGARLEGVDLSEARLQDADLRGVRLDADQLFWAIERGAIIDDALRDREAEFVPKDT